MNSLKQYKVEIIFALILIFLISWLIDPLKLFMPEFLQKPHLLIVTVCFIIFASLIWRERAKDERQKLHRMSSGRWAFLTGTAALVVGIFVERWTTGNVDVWLVISLGAMLLGKIIGHIYHGEKN